MKLIVCALGLVALAQATADIEWPNVMTSEKIVGGYEAVPNSIPYQVAVRITTTGGNFFCSGSLISARYVLTAANCVDYVHTSLEVILGAHHVDDDEDTQVRVKSTSVHIHPGYNAVSRLHNIAVIELPSAVELNDYIKPVDLPTWADAANDFAGYFGRISGWGRYSDGSGRSDVLRYVFADVITNSECYSSYGSQITIGNICTYGNGGVGACNNDGGGPLIAGGIQIGIVSFYSVQPRCESGLPTAFTRVTYYLDWIAHNTDVVIN